MGGHGIARGLGGKGEGAAAAVHLVLHGSAHVAQARSRTDEGGPRVPRCARHATGGAQQLEVGQAHPFFFRISMISPICASAEALGRRQVPAPLCPPPP